jgi:hypothetical protein
MRISISILSLWTGVVLLAVAVSGMFRDLTDSVVLASCILIFCGIAGVAHRRSLETLKKESKKAIGFILLVLVSWSVICQLILAMFYIGLDVPVVEENSENEIIYYLKPQLAIFLLFVVFLVEFAVVGRLKRRTIVPHILAFLSLAVVIVLNYRFAVLTLKTSCQNIVSVEVIFSFFENVIRFVCKG